MCIRNGTKQFTRTAAAVVLVASLSGLTACAANASDNAREAAAAQFADLQLRVERELPNIPETGFVEFVEAGGLKIGGSIIGQPFYRVQQGNDSLVFSAVEHDGTGVVQAVVIGRAVVGGGDLYDDATVFSCFEVAVDIHEKALKGYSALDCPALITEPLSGLEQVSIDELQ